MTERQTDVSYELGGINKQLEAITRTLSENRTADAQYRTGVRERMEEQSKAINTVDTKLTVAQRDITDTKEDVAGINPRLKSLEDRALMSKGAANLAVVLSKGAHVISAGLGAIIAVLLERWLRGPHP